ncbi:MAG: hypothetical protein ACTSRA_23255 [Promethearchaeota archaeon]
MKKKDFNLEISNDAELIQFQNPYLKIIHPITASTNIKNCDVLSIPAWLDSPANIIRCKSTLLELLKKD